MRPELEYRDVVSFYKTQRNDYGQSETIPNEDVEEILGMLVLPTQYTHGQNQDSVRTDAQLILPADNDYLIEKGYRLEGEVISVSPFGVVENRQFFRIAEVNPARDLLFDNEVIQVECRLTKIGALDVS